MAAITYRSVRDPKWIGAGRKQILCTVYFDHIPNEVPFVADPYDVMAHGRDIFARAAAGEFGEVGHISMEEFRAQSAEVVDEVPGWPEAMEFLRQANLENESKTDRGTVSVWSSGLEEFVRRLIAASGAEPRFNYGKCIRQALASGLISDVLADNLALANDVRNEFAHQALATFENSELADQAQNLYDRVVSDGIRLDHKMLFAAAASTMLEELLEATNNFAAQQA